MTIPAGWYPDPAAPSVQRYWDGQGWTEQTSSPPTAAALRAPEGTKVDTVWIWLIVFLPLFSTLPLLLTPWDSMFPTDPWQSDPTAMMMNSFAPYTSPLFVLSSVLGYVVYGACVFFAYRDHRVLLARGVPKPFHWAWSFLNPVYAIGRSVVVHRRTGRGLAPLWATIGVLLTTLIISTVVIVTMLNAALAWMSDTVRDMPLS